MGLYLILFVVIFVVAFVVEVFTDSYGWTVFWALFVLLICFGFYRENQPDIVELRKKEAAEQSAREYEKQRPRVISEADGCKVYRFGPSEAPKYFTRCENSKTTTVNERTESCGKNCRKRITDTVESQ